MRTIDATVHPVRADESDRVLEVWQASVRATHDFLTEADIQFFHARRRRVIEMSDAYAPLPPGPARGRTPGHRIRNKS